MPLLGLVPRPKVLIGHTTTAPRPASPARRVRPSSPTKRTSSPAQGPSTPTIRTRPASPTKSARPSSPTRLGPGETGQAKVLKAVKSMPTIGGQGRAEQGSRSRSEKVVVCVKIKPTNNVESLEAYEISEETGTIALSAAHPQIKKRGGRKAGPDNRYTFDALHQAPTPTTHLYETHLGPLVHQAMRGYNSTVFAYGMTGSGKTHTMSGTAEDIGVIPLAVAGVFEAIEQNSSRHYLLRVSYIEIYNETLRDLLNTSRKPLTDAEKPAIHLENGVVQVSPLVEEIVRSPEEVLKVLRKGEGNRRTGATDWNERSSRSHCVFTITIESREHAQVRRSRLTLIDLAGSEKATVNKERLAEGKFINKSLLSLGMVIEQLADKTRKPGSFIGYRNSKLTHILENALGGNANIAVICTLSLEEHHQAEALETLRFASRCSQVETQAQQGLVLSSEKVLLQAKEEEILSLKSQLEKLATTQSRIDEDQRVELFEEVQGLESRKDRLLRQLALLNGDILTSTGLESGDLTLTAGPSKVRRRVSEYVSADRASSPTKHHQAFSPLQPISRRIFSGMTASEVTLAPAGLEEAFIRSMQEVRETEKQEVGALRTELQQATIDRQRLQDIEEELAQLHRKLGDERTMRAEVQRLFENERENSAHLRDELAELRREKDGLRKELDFIAATNQRAASLPRMANGLPLPLTAGPGPPMASRPTGSLKDHRMQHLGDLDLAGSRIATARHEEEMDRLETIIRGLKSTNDALMDKVAEWRMRVEQQNALIQSLMESPGPTLAHSDFARQLVPTSRGNDQPTTTDSPAQRTFMSSKKYGRLLPSGSDVFSSPPPLPMSPSMESNSPSRGHRRVTVQRDILQLQTSTIVDSARNLFSGLEAGTERTRVVLPSPRRS